MSKRRFNDQPLQRLSGARDQTNPCMPRHSDVGSKKQRLEEATVKVHESSLEAVGSSVSSFIITDPAPLRFNVGSNNSTVNKSILHREKKEILLDGQAVPKLDPSDPESARRIQQRRRMIAYGKNTIGYDEYIKQVPKHKRKPRCPKHPSTPDPTADIPTRRFQGLVKAWRISLHQYDPSELQLLAKPQPTKDCEATNNLMKDLTGVSLVATEECIKSKQILEATRRGLQVGFCKDDATEVSTSPTSVVLADDTMYSSKVESDLFFGNTDRSEALVDYEDDSDEDLL